MGGLIFDWTINFGNVVTTATIFFSGVWFVIKLSYDMKLMSMEIKTMESAQTLLNQSIDRVSTGIGHVAIQDNRIYMLEKTLDEIRHGQGFIHPRKRDTKQYEN
jgi:hypothetical protein